MRLGVTHTKRNSFLLQCFFWVEEKMRGFSLLNGAIFVADFFCFYFSSSKSCLHGTSFLETQWLHTDKIYPTRRNILWNWSSYNPTLTETTYATTSDTRPATYTRKHDNRITMKYFVVLASVCWWSVQISHRDSKQLQLNTDSFNM